MPRPVHIQKEGKRMKLLKKWLPLALCLAMILSLAACGKAPTPSTAAPTEAPTKEETQAPETTKAPETEAPTEAAPDPVVTRVGALKGPTTMGLVKLIKDQQALGDKAAMQFTMVTAADELLASMAKKELDIILIPANVASIFNTKGVGISVIDINTLGVLYLVSSDTSITSVEDLKGKTIALTGKGNTPDYVLQYLLSEHGLSTDDVTLEYKSEATEVAAYLAETEGAIGLLPQPFVTSALMQNDKLSVVMDMTEQWDLAQKDEETPSRLVTGVTVVRNEFLDEHPAAVENFLLAHAASTDFTNTNVDEAAAIIEELGIVGKAAIAKKAIPNCNIVCLTGDEMKAALSGYLKVLYDLNPASVGGENNLPDNKFYYGTGISK